MSNNKNSHLGQIRIADDVIAIVAHLAIVEVDGVDGMYGNITGDIVEKFGVKNLAKGIKVNVGEEDVSISVFITVKKGYNIPTLSLEIQNKVKEAVEITTGLLVKEVNISVMGIAVKEQNKENSSVLGNTTEVIYE